MIELRGVTLKRKNFSALFNVSISSQEFAAVVGVSGSGKSTFLELIAGFIFPESGKTFLDGQDVTNLPVEKRQVSYAFQENALFPHLNIESNVALALHDQNLTDDLKLQQARAILKKMGLSETFWTKKPSELSGGELTRANLARALLRPCKILLLDEPFASLDEETRSKLLDLTYELHLEKKVTTVFVTHQQDDARRFGKHLIEISKGQIVNGA